MKTVKIIFGNITILGQKATVHEIDGIINCTTIIEAVKLGELLAKDYGPYIIPRLFDDVNYECDPNTLTN